MDAPTLATTSARFGTPEAMWHITVRDFPAIETKDSQGGSLHNDLEAASGERLETLKT